MAFACASCGRRPVVKSSKQCAYCGGAIVAGPASGAPAPEAPPAAGVPPVAGRPAAGAPPGSPLPSKPAALSPPAAPRGFVAPEFPDDPPVWKQILAVPFATTGRRIAIVIIAAVALAITSINRLIGSYKPQESGHGLFIPAPGDGPPGMVPPGGAPPTEERTSRDDRAYADLTQIAGALTAYAERNSTFPSELSPDLSELEGLSDAVRKQANFEGNKLEAYAREFSSDFRRETVKISATVRGSNRKVETSVVHLRAAVPLPR